MEGLGRSTSETPFHAVIVAYKLTISGGSYLKDN
jgi:hypothetical protein